MEREQCLRCRYLRPLTGGCAAYPEGIPMEIAEGEVQHDTVFDGQEGVFVFEPGTPDELKAFEQNLGN